MPFFDPTNPSLDLDTLIITRKNFASYIEKNLNERVREEYFNGVRYWIPKGVNKIRETGVQARLSRKDGTKFNKSFGATSYLGFSDPLAQAIIEATNAVMDAKEQSSTSSSTRILPTMTISFGKKSHQMPNIKLDVSQVIKGKRIDHGSVTQSLTSFSFIEFTHLFIEGHSSLLSSLALSKAQNQVNDFEKSNAIEPNELMRKSAEALDAALSRFEARLFEDFPDGDYPTLEESSEASGIKFKNTQDYIHMDSFGTAPSRALQKSEFAGFESFNFAERIASIALWMTKETPEKTYVKPRRLTTSPHPTSGVTGISVSVDNRRRSLVINAHLKYRGSGKGNDKKIFYVSKHGLKEAFKKAVAISRKYFLESELTDSEFNKLYYNFKCHILPRLPDEMIKTVQSELKGISVISPNNPQMIGANRTSKMARKKRKPSNTPKRANKAKES